MYIVKSFCTVDSLVNNDLNTNSDLGELSTQSLTYSIDIKQHSNPLFSGVGLSTFSSKLNGSEIPVVEELSNNALEVCAWAKTNALAGNFNANESDFVALLVAAFSGTLSISDVSVGDMAQHSGNIFLPKWIRFKKNGLQINGNDEDNYIKVWFSDSAFRGEYDEYFIKVVPPVVNMDSLFDTHSAVSTLVNLETPLSRRTREENIRANDPHTSSLMRTFKWVNPINPTETIDLYWSVFIYGAAGNNPDAINAAIISDTLDSSSHTQLEWTGYIPDIFNITEFTIVPLWDNISIPNVQPISSMFSPTVTYKDMLTDIKLFTPSSYTDAHIEEHLESSVILYRSLSYLAISSPTNTNGRFRISDVLSDLFVVSTTSSDFNAISPSTQAWYHMVSGLVYAAETATAFSQLPNGMTRIIRDGSVYLSATHAGIQYLVVTRDSYIASKP